MPQYGIDWSKVDAKNSQRLASLKPSVTAVTEEGAGRARSTRAKREAKPDSVVRSQRRERGEKTAVTTKPDGTVEAVEPEDEGIDLVPENADGEKVSPDDILPDDEDEE